MDIQTKTIKLQHLQQIGETKYSKYFLKTINVFLQHGLGEKLIDFLNRNLHGVFLCVAENELNTELFSDIMVYGVLVPYEGDDENQIPLILINKDYLEITERIISSLVLSTTLDKDGYSYLLKVSRCYPDLQNALSDTLINFYVNYSDITTYSKPNG